LSGAFALALIRQPLFHGFSAQDAITIMASTPKQGMNPAIIPDKKHQVLSIFVPPVHIETAMDLYER